MTTKICDKCGAKINTNPMTNTILPMFSISRIEGFAMGWQSVDLCPKCEKMLSEWLNDNSTMSPGEQDAYRQWEILKPCPFCGGDAELVYTNNSDPVIVYCENCGLEFGHEKYFKTYQAVEAWNRRVSDE